MKKTVRVGSRKSRLAITTAGKVIEAIKKNNPELEVEHVAMETFGDKDLKKSIDSYKKSNLFSEELENALRDKSIDVIINSYKDLPVEEDKEFPIIALSKRNNPLDAIVLKESDKKHKIIGTSCKRRAVQLRELYPDCEVKVIRGTVLSRLEQMDNGDFDGVVLAVAGLERLGQEHRITRTFSLEEMVPSACQGIIAVRGRTGEDYSYLKDYDCKDSHITSQAELTFVKALNDRGNFYNNGVYAQVEGDTVKMIGMYLTPDGQVLREKIEGPISQNKELALQLAESLLKRG